MNPREYEIMRDVEDRYWWYRGMRRFTRVLLPDLFRREGVRILDAGCGTGANLKDMGNADGGPRAAAVICGIDLSPLALRFCSKRGLPRLSQASVEGIPFPPATFDFVTSHDVIYCVPNDVRAVSEFHRVLKPGGRLFLAVAALESLRGEHDSAVHGIRRYSRKDLKEKLENAGFQIERLTFANFFLFPAVFLLRFCQRGFPGKGASGDAASDFDRTPPFTNGLLTALLFFEAFLVRFVNLPFGVTLMAVARKST